MPTTAIGALIFVCVSLLGIIIWIVKRVFDTTIPQMQELFREQLQKQQEMFREEVRHERAFFAETLANHLKTTSAAELQLLARIDRNSESILRLGNAVEQNQQAISRSLEMQEQHYEEWRQAEHRWRDVVIPGKAVKTQPVQPMPPRKDKEG
jgi:uncharacterized membrane-anchored protein YhcB (DUF1043 family)